MNESVVGANGISQELEIVTKPVQPSQPFSGPVEPKHISFKEIKRRALHHALIESGVDELTHTKAIRDNIVDQGPLPFHDDVLPGVVQLANLPNIRIKILTNGDEESVRTVCDAEPNLKELQREGQLEWKDIIISSTSVGKFKPAKEMYQALLSAAGTGVSSKQVWLISTNPVDLAGAIEMGMSTAWVNASGYDWPDHLSADENGKSTRKPDINVKTFELLHDELRKCGVGNPTRV
ncbi:haloacid dehalogenase type II [Venturia nashicola]|uniref:Haloacid dehalogenase type II n=1 Tax=Venturia nashicola TaxID=86259 RepID=A0A4Z1NN75_9PEZI|nr:haloacid dehalogenase type II [Venturia nashicola]